MAAIKGVKHTPARRFTEKKAGVLMVTKKKVAGRRGGIAGGAKGAANYKKKG